MVSIILLVVIGVVIGGLVFMRRYYWRDYAAPVAAGGVPTDMVLTTFAHGNSCLAAGKLTEAITAFQRVLELAPKHPHVAGRLAEVERRQAASATPPVNVAL